jgi:hypothetical protein
MLDRKTVFTVIVSTVLGATIATALSATVFAPEAGPTQVSVFRGTNAVDVRALGAKGDGKADDTDAFEKAIRDAGPGTVYIPPGTYNVSRTLVLDTEGTALRGAGVSASIIRVTEPVTGIRAQRTRAVIENLQLTAGVDTGQPAIQLGLPERAVSNWHLHDLYIQRGGDKRFDVGIRTIGALTGLMERVSVDVTASYGAHLSANEESGPNAITMLNTRFANNGKAGILIENAQSGVHILGGAVEGKTPVGIWIRNSPNTVIENVHSESSGGDKPVHLRIEDSTAGPIVLGGYWYSNPNGTDIEIVKSSRVMLAGLQMQGPTKGGSKTNITIDETSDGTQIIGGNVPLSKVEDKGRNTVLVGSQPGSISAPTLEARNSLVFALPSGEPSESQLANGQASFWLDQDHKTLRIRIRRPDGSMANASIPYN